MSDKTPPQANGNGANFNDMPPDVQVCYKYLIRGFTTPEIAKQLDVSPRTVQRWKTLYNIDELAATAKPETATLPQRAARMAKAGYSYTEIGKKLKRSKATIYNYVRAERDKETATAPDSVPELYQPLFNYLNETFEALPTRGEMDEIIQLSIDISDSNISDFN